jgi:hypothetical protein
MLMGLVPAAAGGEDALSVRAANAAWLHPEMVQYGITLANVEVISMGRLLNLVEQGYYRPAANSDLWAALEAKHSRMARPASPSSSSSAPPFEANVRVNSVTSGNQAEISLDSDKTTGNLYAGWNHGNYCGYSRSEDGGKTWSAVEQYRNGNSWCGDTVVVGHGSTLWRLAMSSVSGGAQEDVSKSTDGGKTWGSWLKASPTTSTNDKPWMDFDGQHLYVAVYDGGPINFFKSDDDGATWSSKKNLGQGQGNCILAGNNGVVIVGWTHINSQVQKSTDYGVNFAQKASGFSSGGEGSSPRTGALATCAASNDKKDMYFTWASAEGGNRRTWVIASTDEGETWSSRVQVAMNSNRQENPGIDVTSDGVVHVGWSEFVGGKVYAYYSNSTDKGKTWSTPIEVSDANGNVDTSFMGHYAALDASPSGRVGYIFCNTQGGDADVWYGAYNYKGGGGGGGNGSISRIDVSPGTASITADQTQQFGAKAYDANNNQVNATFAWTASGGSVDQNGLYTPQAAGTFDVTATVGTVSGKATVTVTHGAAVSVSVTPANPSVAADQTVKFTAEGKDAKGNSWAISPATWSVSGGAGAGSIDAQGLYTPDKVGTYTVEGADPASGLKGTTQVTVTPGAVATIKVTPATASITADQTQQFAATAEDSKGNPVNPAFSWSATGGSVSQSGLFSPDKVGSYAVQAAAGAKSASASIEVTPGALARILVTPSTKTITADDTLPLSAKGEDAKGNEVSITPTWSTQDGTVSSSGLFEPQKSGDWTVTAEQSGIKGTATVKVTPGALASLTIDPPSAIVQKGESQAFALAAADAKGNEITSFTTKWSLEGDAVGDLKDGKLTARAAGEATVKAEVASGGSTKAAEARVVVPGGLFDMKAGGQLPLLIILLIAAVIAIGAIAAIASRRRKKQAPADWYQQQPFGGPAYPDGGMYGAPPPPPAPPPQAFPSDPGPPQGPPTT